MQLLGHSGARFVSNVLGNEYVTDSCATSYPIVAPYEYLANRCIVCLSLQKIHWM
jgi:hypothetical protein